MRLKVSAFDEGGKIPAEYTCEGSDLSPALEWSEAPAGAASFVLILDDPDAPAGVWNHWLLFNIPPSVHGIAEGYKPGEPGESGKNDFGKAGYNGPCPPRGHGPHRYYFRLYALDVPKLSLKKGAKRSELDKALQGHILAQAHYMGRYERR